MVSLFKHLRESMSVCSQSVANKLIKPNELMQAIRESFLANISCSCRPFMTEVCDTQLFAQFVQQRDSLKYGDAFDQWCFHKMKLKTQHYILQQNQDVYGIFFKT